MHSPSCPQRKSKTQVQAAARAFETLLPTSDFQRALSFKLNFLPRPSFSLQLSALACRYHMFVVRDLVLLTVNLLGTLIVAVFCALAFWQVNLELNTGVLQRMGFLFFVGTYFQLTALVGLGMWRTERLIFFQERGAGCYETLPYFIIKTIYDIVPYRIIPALLFSAITYPTVDLRSDDATAVPKALMFTIGLCLSNVVGSVMFNAIGISCSSSGLAVLLAVLYALFTLLFSGFLANATKLGVFGWLSYFSFLRYFFEMVLTNELVDKNIVVQPLISHDGKRTVYPGDVIIGHDLGFFDGECARVLPQTSRALVSACWFDLYIPAIWVFAGLIFSYILLHFCCKHPY